MSSPSAPLPRVVIVGSGFGGLTAAKSLKKVPVQVTILDRRNYHLFQPLLYQVATAALSPSDIASPIRKILRHQRNVEVLLGEATSIDLERKSVHINDGSQLTYDFLILATGATHAYFGHQEWSAFAPGLKTVDDALEIRRRILFAFEAAETESDPERRKAWLTFVVVGGGPTGVEMAGALSEIAQHALSKDFRRIDPKQAEIHLFEGGKRVLSTFDPSLSESAKRQLEGLGVKVSLGRQVTAIDDEGIHVGDEHIASKTVVWAAGVAASDLAKSLKTPLDKAGRVNVENDLTLPGHSEVFVIGDLATLKSNGKPVPGVAPAAMQEGQHSARSIQRTLAGKPREDFVYWDKGSMATIGRRKGIAEIGKIKLSGLIAWMSWLMVHIVFLIGFRNRFLVLYSWAWSYITYERGSRLITGEILTDAQKIDEAKSIEASKPD